MGKGTYGSKRGRPPMKSKAKTKSLRSKFGSQFTAKEAKMLRAKKAKKRK